VPVRPLSPTISAAEAVRDAALPLTGSALDYNALLDRIGDSRLVLLGEASHGTHEFYRERATITKRLLREKGFTAVAVEADWPDAFRVNRWVRGAGHDETAEKALSGFQRFPTWMWRNADVLDFIGWLRLHNEGARPKVGFYGLDLYSLHASMAEVIRYLEKVDPGAARLARRRYACFDHFGEEPQEYGMAAGLGIAASCEDDVVHQLVELRGNAADYASRDGRVAEDEYFFAVENARLVKNAEQYYRAMFRGRVLSWNLRDQHMAETLDSLFRNLEERDGTAKVVVWAHNSHLGDARATEMGESGEWNVGQLARTRHGDDAFLVGFSTHTGTVTAASEWDGPAERKSVRPSLAGSWESLFHEVGFPRFLVTVRGAERELTDVLGDRRLERAIGVIYLPETERVSHYFHATLNRQFDAVLHFDTTRAVEPLERSVPWDRAELPETYPTGI
jgi:erythromycin esterase-like protein